MQVSLLLGCGEANRSADDCPWKDNMLFTGPKGRGHATQGSARFHQEAQRMRQQSGQEPLLLFMWQEVGVVGVQA